MHRAVFLAALIAALMAVPASASAAGYNLSQRQAERRAVWTAEDRYPGQVAEVGSQCRPQGMRLANPARIPRFPATFHVHRWMCVGSGLGPDGDVFGAFIIAGNSDGGWSYIVWIRKQRLFDGD